MKFRFVQEKTQIWPKFFLFDFSLHYNRGISMVCSNVFEYVLKFFKNLVEKDFFPTHFDTLGASC
jgi:hypothetical protein